MNFWERVDYERDYRNIDRKKLASEAGFDVSNISKGIKNGNIPSADTAVRIAGILGVSAEYLVMGTEMTRGKNARVKTSSSENFEALFIRYRKVLNNLETLDETRRDAVISLIEKLSEVENK